MSFVTGINMLELYYDATSESIQLSNGSHERIIRIQLYDINGIIQPLEFRIAGEEATASVASLDKGIYFIRILTGTGTQLLKFIL
jgi:hypothetical protein